MKCTECPEYIKCQSRYDLRSKRRRCPKAKEPKIYTNSDKIRAMTVEELTDLLRGLCKNAMDCDECPMHESCPEGSYDLIPWMEWLQSPAESPTGQKG